MTTTTTLPTVAEVFHDGLLQPDPAAEHKTWTFFGHWTDADELLIDHAVEGEHDDVRPDDGTYERGLWAASASGATIAEAEANARAEYEDDEGGY